MLLLLRAARLEGPFGGHWLALRSQVDKDAIDTATGVVYEGRCDLFGFLFQICRCSCRRQVTTAEARQDFLEMEPEGKKATEPTPLSCVLRVGI